MPSLYKYFSLLLAVFININCKAQYTDFQEDIFKRLEALPLENRVILSTDTKISIWAEHYELIFDSILLPLDTLQVADLVEKYAAERLFIADNCKDSSILRTWAANHNILTFNTLHTLQADSVFILNNENLSLQIATALRQQTAETWKIWYYMIAGLLSGIFIYVLTRLFFNKKKLPNAKK
jgi:hypothetical protein